MNHDVVLLVLLAAFLHALWNALAKSGGQPLLSVASYRGVSSVLCFLALPWVVAPLPASWPLLFASVLVHNVYYFCLAKAYQSGDLSQVYPVIRGAAPLMVALGAAIFLGELLSWSDVAGIAFVSAGLLSLVFARGAFGHFPIESLKWAALTAVLIASYTVLDGAGVRASGEKLGFIVWLFAFEAIPVGAFLLLTRRQEWVNYLKAHRGAVLFAGVSSSIAYGLVIYAMTVGSIAIVSSIRETSVLFAAFIGSVFLREPFGRQRLVAAFVVALGVVFMRFF